MPKDTLIYTHLLPDTWTNIQEDNLADIRGLVENIMERDFSEVDRVKSLGVRVDFVHLHLVRQRKGIFDMADLPPQHAQKVTAIFRRIDTLIEAGIPVNLIKYVEDITDTQPGDMVIVGGAARDDCVAARKEYLDKAGARSLISDLITWEGCGMFK